MADLDYAALRVKVEMALRAVRNGEGKASAEAVALAEQALDIGTQALVRDAASAFGLLDVAAEPEAEAPAESEAPSGKKRRKDSEA